MSDNIPFELQMEIIKKVSNVKSLIQFRSVSKPWKSFIDNSEFINGYGARHTQPHSCILSYKSDYFMDEAKYICLVDDNIETLKVQKQELTPFVMSLLLKQYCLSFVVGTCHGLMCLYGFHKGCKNWMVVIWNPSIGKSFGIVVPSFYSQSVIYSRNQQTINHSKNQLVFGFGVCPNTRDPIVVKIIYAVNMPLPWYAEVFTLSSGVWTVIPCSKLPRESIELNKSTQVVIDRFIYWGACDMIFADDTKFTNHMVVSFDLITKEFKVVDLPDSFTKELYPPMSVFVCKLSESLVVFGYIKVEEALCCEVWVMDHDSSFRKLFTIGTPVDKLLGFSKSGGAIVETRMRQREYTTLDVYDPTSQQIKNVGISGVESSFIMDFYKESLLLLDHPDLHIYSYVN
ncbi:probable galacturonosyltransferase 7 isoform X2 [Tanacetum coccineum]